MSKNLEIERKFLVKFPASWSALSEMFENLIDVKRIAQTYLKKHSDEEQSGRVRKTIEGLTGDKEVVYHFNQKKELSTGVQEEKEKEISREQYKDYLKNSDPDKVEINKTRFVFKFKDQVFELDVFKGPLSGLAILEIELEDKNQKVDLPNYLEVIREATEDKRFNNFNLASRKLHQKL